MNVANSFIDGYADNGPITIGEGYTSVTDVNIVCRESISDVFHDEEAVAKGITNFFSKEANGISYIGCKNRTLKTVGASAFASDVGLNVLSEIDLPYVQEIGERAFYCGIDDFRLVCGVSANIACTETIGPSAFYLSHVNIMNAPSLKTISECAFLSSYLCLNGYGCSEMEDGVGETYFSIFDYFTTYSGQLTSIGASAFKDSTLSLAYFPHTLSSFGADCLSASSLSAVWMGGITSHGLTSIEGYAETGNPSGFICEDGNVTLNGNAVVLERPTILRSKVPSSKTIAINGVGTLSDTVIYWSNGAQTSIEHDGTPKSVSMDFSTSGDIIEMVITDTVSSISINENKIFSPLCEIVQTGSKCRNFNFKTLFFEADIERFSFTRDIDFACTSSFNSNSLSGSVFHSACINADSFSMKSITSLKPFNSTNSYYLSSSQLSYIYCSNGTLSLSSNDDDTKFAFVHTSTMDYTSVILSSSKSITVTGAINSDRISVDYGDGTTTTKYDAYTNWIHTYSLSGVHKLTVYGDITTLTFNGFLGNYNIDEVCVLSVSLSRTLTSLPNAMFNFHNDGTSVQGLCSLFRKADGYSNDIYIYPGVTDTGGCPFAGLTDDFNVIFVNRYEDEVKSFGNYGNWRHYSDSGRQWYAFFKLGGMINYEHGGANLIGYRYPQIEFAGRWGAERRKSCKPNYLTLIARESDTNIAFGYYYGVGVQYNVNDTGWNSFDSENHTVCLANAGDFVRFRGYDVRTGYVRHFVINTGSICASGSVTSLIDGNGGDENCQLNRYCFGYMFKNCSELYSTDHLGNECTVELPSINLSVCCYYGMFMDCTSLTTAPALPARILPYTCYREMFNGCTSLTTAPELPAIILGRLCYYRMFRNCTSLTTAPVLPARILRRITHCYFNMFTGCTSLTSVKTYQSSFDGCAGWLPSTDGTFYCTLELRNALKKESRSISTVPETWTIEVMDTYGGLHFVANTAKSAVSLNKVGTPNDVALETSTDLVNWVEYTPGTTGVIPLTAIGDTVYFRAVSSNSTFSSGVNNYYSFAMTGSISAKGKISSLLDSDMAVHSICDDGFYALFKGCSSLTTAPELDITSLGAWCYFCMFEECTSLLEAPELPAATLARGCYFAMFGNCKSLSSVHALSADTLAEECYGYMFGGCTSLLDAPAISATTLDSLCCGFMFASSTSLTSMCELPARKLSWACYSNMFKSCSSLRRISVLAADELEDYCYYNMFKDSGVKISENGGSGTVILDTTSFSSEMPSNWSTDMFYNTEGTFTGTPTVGNKYYNYD